MKENLSDKRVALVAPQGCEASFIRIPCNALKERGAKVELISNATNHMVSIESGQDVSWEVDHTLSEADPSLYNSLVMVDDFGGLAEDASVEKLTEFCKAFFRDGKPVSALGHAPLALAKMGLAKGRVITCHAEICEEVKEAGAQTVDEAVHVDSGFTTGRDVNALEAFTDKMVEEVGEGRHSGQSDKTGI